MGAGATSTGTHSNTLIIFFTIWGYSENGSLTTSSLWEGSLALHHAPRMREGEIVFNNARGSGEALCKPIADESVVEEKYFS